MQGPYRPLSKKSLNKSDEQEQNKFKLTPYIKAFKSRLEDNTDEASESPTRSFSETRERVPTDRDEFLSKINKFGEKKTTTSKQQIPKK